MNICLRRPSAGLAFAIAIAIASSVSSGSHAATPVRDTDPDNDFVIRNVRVFDGMRVLSNTNVLVIDGRIAAVGAKFDAPKDFPAIDGSGKTLLPGLIDEPRLSSREIGVPLFHRALCERRRAPDSRTSP